jgi:hypothetical protein
MAALGFRARVRVFDANIRVGDRHDEAVACREPAQLLAEMDRHGVGRALIYHAQSDDISPVDGNVALEAWLCDDERLYPQWSVMPGEDSPAQIQSLYAQRRVGSVRLHDTWLAGAAGGLPFRPWAYDDLLGWLAARGIPVWIPVTEIGADDLVTTLGAHRDLVTVLVGAHYVHHLMVRPLLRALPNAHLELSRYEPIGAVEALCRGFGAERLVYGSWYARYGMGPMLYYLHHADLSEEELALVCGGNLERILGGEVTPAYTV